MVKDIDKQDIHSTDQDQTVGFKSRHKGTRVTLNSRGSVCINIKGKLVLPGTGQFLCAIHPSGTMSLLDGMVPKVGKAVSKNLDLVDYDISSSDRPMLLNVIKLKSGAIYRFSRLFDFGKRRLTPVLQNYSYGVMFSISITTSCHATLEELEAWTGVQLPMFHRAWGVDAALKAVFAPKERKEFVGRKHNNSKQHKKVHKKGNNTRRHRDMPINNNLSQELNKLSLPV